MRVRCGDLTLDEVHPRQIAQRGQPRLRDPPSLFHGKQAKLDNTLIMVSPIIIPKRFVSVSSKLHGGRVHGQKPGAECANPAEYGTPRAHHIG